MVNGEGYTDAERADKNKGEKEYLQRFASLEWAIAT